MERLTIKAPSGLIHLKDNAEMTMNVAIKKLAEYEDLEEQGRLLELPCTVGDTVWFIKSSFSFMSEPKEEKIRKIEIIPEEIIFRTTNRCFNMGHIRKTVFLAREEAEAALKEMSK